MALSNHEPVEADVKTSLAISLPEYPISTPKIWTIKCPVIKWPLQFHTEHRGPVYGLFVQHVWFLSSDCKLKHCVLELKGCLYNGISPKFELCQK